MCFLRQNDQESSLSEQEYPDEHTTPLEIINLFLSEGRSAGDKTLPLFYKINQELSWHALLENGYQTELVSLLYYIINKKTPYKHTIGINDSIKQKLKCIRNYLLIKRLLQRDEMIKIFDAFENDGIPVIPLKGAYLAEKYYPHATLRNMEDIDILVQEKDKAKSMDCMQRLGFVFYSRIHDESYYHEHHFHLPYIKLVSDIPILVELHFHIDCKPFLHRIKIEDFWTYASPMSNKYNYVLVPRKELVLLHCIWHTYLNLSHRGLTKLIWLLDMAFLINGQTGKIDWHFLEKKVTEAGIQKRDYFCMELCKQLLGISLDKKPSDLLMPKPYEKYLFQNILLNSNPKNRELKNLLFRTILKLISVGSFSGRMQCLKQMLQESIELLKLKLYAKRTVL